MKTKFEQIWRVFLANNDPDEWSKESIAHHFWELFDVGESLGKSEDAPLPPLDVTDRPKIRVMPAHGSGFIAYYDPGEMDAYLAALSVGKAGGESAALMRCGDKHDCFTCNLPKGHAADHQDVHENGMGGAVGWARKPYVAPKLKQMSDKVTADDVLRYQAGVGER